MRYDRQEKIIDLIRENEIETQEKLASLLRKEGFKVTQATVSRDIRELNLVKVLGKNGRSCYAEAPGTGHKVNERFKKILRETIQSINSAENLIVIKTLNGCANAAAEAIDTNQFPEIIGTLAGDNTILLIIASREYVPRLTEEFNAILA